MKIVDVGLIDYEKAVEIQKELLEKRISGEIEDTIIVAEHYPVVTMGRLSVEGELIDKKYFEKNNIPVVRSSRGGKATFHAPGQVVLYPIVDLSEMKDVSLYIDLLEKAAEKGLEKLGVKAVRIKGKRGVWAGGKKIAFTGVAFKKWVAYHGISVNVNNDIEPFSKMNPCGEAILVTSVRERLGIGTDLVEAKKIFAESFIEQFQNEDTFARSFGR